jgi:hypothetical protein
MGPKRNSSAGTDSNKRCRIGLEIKLDILKRTERGGHSSSLWCEPIDTYLKSSGMQDTWNLFIRKPRPLAKIASGVVSSELKVLIFSAVSGSLHGVKILSDLSTRKGYSTDLSLSHTVQIHVVKQTLSVRSN